MALCGVDDEYCIPAALHAYLLTYYTMNQSPSGEAKQFLAGQEIESDGLLPQLQVPATCSCPEPGQSVPYPCPIS